MKMQRHKAVTALFLGASMVAVSLFNLTAASAAGSKGSNGNKGGSGGSAKPSGGNSKPSQPGGGKPGQPGGGQGSDIALIQAALGITLTDAQKTALTTAATTRDTAVKAALDAYKAQVAAIFGLSADNLDAKIQTYLSSNKGAPKDFNALLAAVLGVTLTDAQKSALVDAANARDAAILVAVDAYRTSVAATVGLSVSDLDAKIQAYLKAHPQGGGGNGGCPPGGPGSGSSSGSGSGSTSGSGSGSGSGSSSGSSGGSGSGTTY